MVIIRVPYRMSFFGGGTDYPAFYNEHTGAVLSTTIDKYCYVCVSELPSFYPGVKYRVIWSHQEAVNTIDEILHPTVRAALKFMDIDVPLSIHHMGDLPSRTGMGSSSSFAVGLILALSKTKGIHLDKSALCKMALELEQDVMNEPVGSQDQTAAVYGGLNKIEFYKNILPFAKPIHDTELEENLMMFYLGESRAGMNITREVISNIPKKTKALYKMMDMVDRAGVFLRNGEYDNFGRLMHESWLLKKSLADTISNDRVDKIYQTAMENGALGGKLMGAGSTGFMVFYVPKEKREAVRNSLGLLHVPFKFETEGAKVIYG